MRSYLLLLLPILMACTTYSQSFYDVEGTISDSSGLPIQGVNVRLYAEIDSAAALTNPNGVFHFSKVRVSAFQLRASYFGTGIFTQSYKIDASHNDIVILKPIVLGLPLNQLAEVVISIDPVTIKEDTIEYQAGTFKVRDGVMAEDLIKKLPGVEVDGVGRITAQGREVTRIRVNGKDFFDGDILTATRNLPADAIDNIQIIDDYGERARFTKMKTGDAERVININMKKSKRNGFFGNATGAVGTDKHYLAGVSLNRFKGERQLSLIASSNNINNSSSRFKGDISAENGTSSVQSAGINYRDKWNRKLSAYGSYYYYAKNNNIVSDLFQQDYSPQNTRITDCAAISNLKSTNHRFDWNIEYNIDTMNYLKLVFRLSYTDDANAANSSSKISSPLFFTGSLVQDYSSSKSLNTVASIYYNHRFRKVGRNLAFDFAVNSTSADEERQTGSVYHNIDSSVVDTAAPAAVHTTIRQQQVMEDGSKSSSTAINLSYVEPMNNAVYLEGNYNLNSSETNDDRRVYDLDSITGNQVANLGQTNHYSFSFITNCFGINLRKVTKKYNYVLGVAVQTSNIEGRSGDKNGNTDYSFTNWVPNARFIYNIAKNHLLTVSYKGSSRAPGYAQLQPVADSSSLVNIVTGNPNLKPEFTNRFNVGYNRFDKKSGSSLYANFAAEETQNKIVSLVLNVAKGTGRTTTYVNTNGFYAVSGNINFTKPFSEKKYSANLSLFSTYSNNTSFTDSQKNDGSNFWISPGARFKADITDKIDLNINANYSFYKTVTNYVSNKIAASIQSFTINISGKNFLFKNWTLGYDYSKTFNYGYQGSMNTNPDVLNLSVEYAFLKGKAAQLRLQAFDLFNENTGITHAIVGTTITDSRINRLGRCFLLIFDLKLHSFH